MSAFGICGISGRMGKEIFRAVRERDFALGAAFDIQSSPFFGKDPGECIDGEKAGCIVSEISSHTLQNCDAAIDFSAPVATMALLEAALQSKTPVVIATTGFSEEQEKEIAKAAESIPVVKSTNMSVGVNLLFKLVEMAAQALPADYDTEVFEAHHRHKKDSPSGTAKTLIKTIKNARKQLPDMNESYRASGITGPRRENELGVQVLRGGGIVGEHTAFFVSENDRIEITHRAGDRKIFADGAVEAALFAAKAVPGLYSMFDVLDIG